MSKSRLTIVRAPSALVLVIASFLALHLTPGALAQVRWRNGGDAPPAPANRADLRGSLESLANRPDQRRFVARFEQIPSAADRQSLRNAGITLLSFLGDNSFFASCSPDGVDAAAAAAVPSLTDARGVERAWKTHPLLTAAVPPAWTVLDAGKAEQRPGDPLVAVYVVFHADQQLNAAALNTVGLHGGAVRDRVRSVNALVVEIGFTALKGLIDEDMVQWVEPALPRMGEVNNNNRARTGADVVQSAPYGLDGSGVKVLVYDAGRALATHPDFGGRLTARDFSPVLDHSTHVSGTIGGSGAASGGLYRGMAPGVTIESYGFEYDGSGIFLYSNPGDIESDYNEAINTFGVAISSNSIGTNTAPNGFPCEIEGDYGVTDALIDAIVAGGLGRPFRVIWANGNERGYPRCGGEYHTTAPPACAKNSICVGALNSNDDSVTSFTSWGPTDDGRLKPDVSAPGCQSNDDFGVTSTLATFLYGAYCGTSMACPTVCGLSALLLEDFRSHYPSRPDPRNSTLKALLAHTAVDIGAPGPDYQTGYGSVRIQPCVDFMRSGSFFEDQVAHAGVRSALVVVNPGDPFLKVTLAWDDPAGTPNVVPNLVNDLDLRVFGPDNIQRFPWTLDPAHPGDPAVRTTEDHVNNSEQVFVEAPAPGVWRVDVVGYAVASGPQTFSLCASPALVECSSRGVIAFQKQTYRCQDVAGIHLVDCDLNTDNQAVDTAMVLVTSTSDPAGAMVTLIETAEQTAAFTGTVGVGTAHAPGVVQVADGDTLTISYIDANNGAGGTNVVTTATGRIDCQVPVISDVQVMAVGPHRATVTFQTNEPATASVSVGSSCGSLSRTASAPGLLTNHTVLLADLPLETTSYFEIHATDAAGNNTRDGGPDQCYSVTTTAVPDFLSESFTQSGPSFDLANRSLLFTPDGSISFYSVCASSGETLLPADTTSGQRLLLTNDSFQRVDLGGGATVSLFGVSYSSFYVGSNGYITFQAGDSTRDPGYFIHFAAPRISPYFSDLDPGIAGSVTWRQLPDRMAVTWWHVPHWSVFDSNTFQVEMYFDGRIRLSWLGLAPGAALAGLSPGGGISPDFVASDLSTHSSCGPRPPYVQAQTVDAPLNASVAFSLVASDDDQPAPSHVSFRILSLPRFGSLSAGGAGLSNVPYSVPAGVPLTYRTVINFTGIDSFTFVANDGGSPPGGGDSDAEDVVFTVGAPRLIFGYDLTTDPGWAREGGWAYGRPLGHGSFGRDPTAGFTGPNVFGYNLAGDYPNNLLNTEYLTLGPIDCSRLARTQLSFRRWLGIEPGMYDFADIEVRAAGGPWSVIWTNPIFSTTDDGSWTYQAQDISTLVDGRNDVYIRWGLGPTDPIVTYPGWNIDDVRIIAVGPVMPSLADFNHDGMVGNTDLGILLGNWGPCPPDAMCISDLDGDGKVGTTDLSLLLGAWGLLH